MQFLNNYIRYIVHTYYYVVLKSHRYNAQIILRPAQYHNNLVQRTRAYIMVFILFLRLSIYYKGFKYVILNVHAQYNVTHCIISYAYNP